MKTLICTIITIVFVLVIWSDNALAQSPGNALDFDGSNDYVSVPDAAALDITDQITIEGWFKPSASSWAYKKLISIDNTKVSATLSNFPVLVSVTDTELLDSGNGGSIQPDGDDILFVGTDGSKLSHEIEEYDGSTGKLVAWVKVPSLSSSEDTDFYLYYGNSGCSSQQDITGVWSSNYTGIWHMKENPIGTTIFSDGIENTSDWDAKWDGNGVTTWTQATDQKTEGTYSAKAANGSEGLFTSDDINTSGATYFTVDFWFRKNGIEQDDVTLYFYDGTTYDSIAVLDDLGSDNAWIHFSEVYNDVQYNISNFRIRFDAVLGGGESFWVDDLKVIEDGPEFPDSSPTNEDGVKSGATETTGYISKAQDFDGLDDRVIIGDVFDSPAAVTMSAWVKHDNVSNVVERYSSFHDRVTLRHDGAASSGQLHFYVRTTGDVLHHIRLNGVLSNDTWYYVTGTWDGTESKLYLDGSVRDSVDASGTLMDPDFGTIGHGTNGLDGIIDEVRISSTARDSSWIGTEFRNQSSPGTFMTVSGQTTASISKYGAYGLGTNNTNAYASINDQTISGSINAGAWNHISLTYNKDAGGTNEMKLYINGVESATGDYSTAISTNNNSLLLGNMAGFLGQMDEVRLWDTVRTVSEIRENMRRTVDKASANLVAYWQFNASSGTAAADSAGTNNGTLINMTDADWVASTAPFGGGLANDTTGFDTGTADLGTFSLTTTEDFDNAVDITATEILNGPNTIPAVPDSLDDRYWVVDVYGTPGTYSTNVTFTLPDGYLTLGEEADLQLYHRSSNSDGSWTLVVDGAASMTSTTVTFNGVTDMGQFTIAGSSGFPMPVELTSFTADFDGSTVKLQWETATELNNYGFEVQRSSKTDRWNIIGFVEGHGNTYSPKKYVFTDDLSGLSDPSDIDSLQYRLKQIDLDGKYEYYELGEAVNLLNITGIGDELVPAEFELYQNYPNPFNPSTTIKFGLPESGQVLVEVYNSIGQKAATLINSELPAGYHQVQWNASDLSSGMYLYRITAENFVSVKKMLMIK